MVKGEELPIKTIVKPNALKSGKGYANVCTYTDVCFVGVENNKTLYTLV